MISWIKKHFWQIIGTLIAVIGIFGAYDVYFRSKQIKELKVITSLPLSLVNINPEAANDIQVLYKGKPVNNISLFQVQITNTGNQPILETEYNKPLTLLFTPNNEILDAAVISSNPSNVGMEISNKSQSSIEMSKTLLNPQDIVSVRFVIKGNTGEKLLKEFNATGRVAGVKDISAQSSIEQNSMGFYIALFGVIIGVIVGLFISIVMLGFETARKLFKRSENNKQSE